MDVSMEDDNCTIDVVTPIKKKKMKQAQLPFQTSSASKSSNSIDNVINKKKRKTMSPLMGSKSPKLVKLATKENLAGSMHEREEDTNKRKLNSSDNIEIITSDDEKKNSGHTDQKTKKDLGDTPKRRNLGKNKKLDKLQQKSGALTKFLKKTDKEIEENVEENIKKNVENDISHDNNSSELKDKREYCDTSINKEKSENNLNKNLDISFIQSESQDTSQLNKTDDCNKNTSQESDCDILTLSSDESISDVNKSISSKEMTDKSATPVTPKSDKDLKNKVKKLTPKQLEKKQEIAKRKEEKLKLRMEKEKKREEERANRRKEREEKQREKEEKERKEKEQKKKEKELKELKKLKKQMEIEQKQKEKEAKEEERKKREEAKEEEKRRKEEERLEAERKKQKAASNFASFFVPKKQEAKTTEEENVVEIKNFMPFEIKADMRIAPISRRKLSEQDKLLLDNKCNVYLDKTELYLEDIKRKRIVPRTSSKTWPLEAKDDIILLDEDNDGSSKIIMDTHNLEKHRPKLLQFSENRRPPYWGTWRKRSNVLNFRRPFVKDKKWFDYEVDSDDEWEEEEPGESLKGSDDEKDEENSEENEYDIDNEFMVPHGYLSDEEAQADEEEMEDMSPQTQKMKLKILGEQFEAERNTKTHKLKPKIIGCIWQGSDNSFPAFISPKVKEFLSARQAWVNNIPITFPSSTSAEEDMSANAENKTPIYQQSVRGSKKTKFPDDALPDLIRLIHGNRHGRHVLLKEFMTFWNKTNGSHLSKVSVLSKINEIAKRIACPEEGPMHLKSCWYVPENIRKQYLPDVELPLPNRWKYILIPDRKSDNQNVADKNEKEERDKEKEKKHVPLITQFTKKITQEEMKKQLAKSDEEETKKQSTAKLNQEDTLKQLAANPDQEEIKKQSMSKSDRPKLPPLQRPPKRATLISVGRGEQFSEISRQNMLAEFVSLKKKEETSNDEKIDNSDKIIETNKTN